MSNRSFTDRLDENDDRKSAVGFPQIIKQDCANEFILNKKILENLNRSFHQMKTGISNANNCDFISKNQGTSIDNYFKSKILDEIYRIVNKDIHELTAPFLYLTDNLNDGFKKEKLITFFETEISILSKIETTYSDINKYYQEFVSRLVSLNGRG